MFQYSLLDSSGLVTTKYIHQHLWIVSGKEILGLQEKLQRRVQLYRILAYFGSLLLKE